MNLQAIRDAIEQSCGERPDGAPQAIGGGCINEAFRLGDFFVKTNDPAGREMFETERLGLAEISATKTIRVPHPISSGCTDEHAYLVLEFLPLGSRTAAAQEEMGRQLALLHRTTQNRFGWNRDNFIGATPQPNSHAGSWIDFLREHRLEHMIRLAGNRGFRFPSANTLLDQLDRFFDCEPAPSLLHGDLWGGNAGALKDGTPVVYDPAVYFGDREADLAMTHLFGGFSSTFYAAYEEAWPLPAGHQRRRTLYNLYHILNHAVLFGGGYARQAQEMINRLLSQA